MSESLINRRWVRALALCALAAVLSMRGVTDSRSDAPSITIAPQVVAPGDNVRVTGRGFPPARRINLMLAGHPVGQTNADERGAFSYVVTVNPAAFRGRYPLEATVVGSPDVVAMVILTVAGPAVTPVPASNTPTTLRGQAVLSPPTNVTFGSVPNTTASSSLGVFRASEGTDKVATSKRTSGSIAGVAVIVAVLGLGLGSLLARRASARGRRRGAPSGRARTKRTA